MSIESALLSASGAGRSSSGSGYDCDSAPGEEDLDGGKKSMGLSVLISFRKGELNTNGP
jgi:hypothetical protein